MNELGSENTDEALPDSIVPATKKDAMRRLMEITGEFEQVSECFTAISSSNEASLYKLRSGPAYFGDFRRHASMYREDINIINDDADRPVSLQKPHNAPQSYAAAIGKIHHIYRFDLPARLSMKLDEDALQPETKELVAEFHDIMARYRKAVMLTREDLNETQLINGKIVRNRSPQSHLLLPKMVADHLNAAAADICLRFYGSELACAETIPVIMGGQHRITRNENNIGMFLFGLQSSERFQIDLNRVPEKYLSFLTQITGTSDQIISNIAVRLLHDDVAAQRKDKAFQTLLPEILKEIKEAGRSLQMANLVCENNVYLSSVYDLLLQKVGMKPLPDRLETPLECALVLENVVANPAFENHHTITLLASDFRSIHKAESFTLSENFVKEAVNATGIARRKIATLEGDRAERACLALELAGNFVTRTGLHQGSPAVEMSRAR